MNVLIKPGRCQRPTPRQSNLNLPELKREVEAKTLEVQACQLAEAEASSQLRSDQAKLADLQDRIERLDKTLEKLGGTAIEKGGKE